MPSAAALMAVAILLICIALAAAVQFEEAHQEDATGRSAEALVAGEAVSQRRASSQGLMRKEQLKTSASLGNVTNATVKNPAYDMPVPMQELQEFDPVWAYGPHPIEQLFHRTFRPTVFDAEPPRNYAYCHKGGASGPRFEDSLSFDGAPLPKPPMTIAASLSTEQLGRFQVILGWGEGANSWDAAEFRLSASGNLQYGIHDGLAWHNVEAKPAVNLMDGHLHHVAMVRDENGVADLFINGTRVGYGLIAGNPRVPMKSARAARTMYGLRDLAFTGNVSQVFVYDRALRWWEVNKVPYVPCREQVPVMTRINFANCVTYRNLGGYGPDRRSELAGPNGMRFEAVAGYGGVQLDLLITNISEYDPRRPDSNGIVMNGSAMGHINIRSGTFVGLRFELVAHRTFHPVTVDNFYFAFMDLDSGPFGTGRESLTFLTDVANYYISADSTLHHSHPNQTTNLVAWAGDAATGDFGNNPTDPLDLDDAQERRSLVVVFAHTSGFEVVFNSTPGIGGRDVSFAGWSTLMLDAFNSTLGQGPPQTAADTYQLDPEGHAATGDEMSAGTWEY